MDYETGKLFEGVMAKLDYLIEKNDYLVEELEKTKKKQG